jgi:AraC-like DNA-binding protein
MIFKRIENWFKKIEKYLFSYKDGYFVFPYISNTPELLVEGLKNMPFTNFDKSKNIISCNNPFMKGEFRYQEIEEGLWMTVTNLEFKVNIHTKTDFDNEKSDYFFLSFSNYENNAIQHKMLINNKEVASGSWTLYNPNTKIEAYHSKGTKGIYYNFSIHKDWIMKNLMIREGAMKREISKLMENQESFLIFEDAMQEANHYVKKIWEMINKDNMKYLNKLQLKIITLEIINLFFVKIQLKTRENSSKIYKKSNRKAFSTIENAINKHLKSGFPGIEHFAALVNMSPSQLKVKFKEEYKKTLFQYFKEKQMEMAFQILKNSNEQIKNVAIIFGYESPSKFSKGFKKYFGYLPSQILKNE